MILYDRRKFRSQTSDNMDRWKAEMGRVREKRRVKERRSEKRKSQKKEDAGARKGRKVAKHSVFPMICGSGGSKSRLAKAAGAEPSGQMRDEKLHAVVARSTFRSQNVQSTPGSTFGSCDVEKVHAVVARSTFQCHNVQNTPGPDHFWKLRCRVAGARDCAPCQKWAKREGFVAFSTTTTTTPHYTPIHHTTTTTTPSLHSTTLHYTPLHSTTLHYTTLH